MTDSKHDQYYQDNLSAHANTKETPDQFENALELSNVASPKVVVTIPSFEVITPLDGLYILKYLEEIGRTCYQSYRNTKDDSCYEFVRMLIRRGHEAMLEHFSFAVRFVVDRAVQNELVRHRIGSSFAVESTRYVNYSLEKNGGAIRVICPPQIKQGTAEYDMWVVSMQKSSDTYFELVKTMKPEIARSVLPLALRTEMVMSANLRQWRNVFKLRCDKAAHPQVRMMMLPLLSYVKKQIPVVFDDLDYPEELEL